MLAGKIGGKQLKSWRSYSSNDRRGRPFRQQGFIPLFLVRLFNLSLFQLNKWLMWKGSSVHGKMPTTASLPWQHTTVDSHTTTIFYYRLPFLLFFGSTSRCQAEWSGKLHGKKGFVILTKSFVQIGITKTFCYNNKMFSSVNKTFGCCSKIFGCSNKFLSVVPNFNAVTKPFFPCSSIQLYLNDWQASSAISKRRQAWWQRIDSQISQMDQTINLLMLVTINDCASLHSKLHAKKWFGYGNKIWNK